MIPGINGKHVDTNISFRFPSNYRILSDYENINKVFIKRMEGLGCTSGDDSSFAIKNVFKALGEEEYALDINESYITIYSLDEKGFSLGLVTLFQMLVEGSLSLNKIFIKDKPRFPYRSFMLDCSRHFIGIDEIKKIIDQASLLKFNHFHWHLSDDQGYRLESKKYPLLNEIGSYRLLSAGDPVVTNGKQKENERYGGYYKKEEVSDLIEYSRERCIEIVPEIELPGHTAAMMSSYPMYTCSKEPLIVKNQFGIFKRVLCASSDQSFEFACSLLDEVMDMFPGKYIHLGGDETPKKEWMQCDCCTRVMKEKGFESYDELQAHFENRIVNHVLKRGKTPILYNESFKSKGINKNAVCQYWWEGEKESYSIREKDRRKFIMSNMNSFYMDYDYAQVSINSTLEYEPEIKNQGIDDKAILGIDAPLWTEWIESDKEIESHIHPRLLAVSECAWSMKKDRTAFKERVIKFLGFKKLSLLDENRLNDVFIDKNALIPLVLKNMQIQGSRYRDSRFEADEDNVTFIEANNEMDIIEYVYDKVKHDFSKEEVAQAFEKIVSSSKN